MATVNFVGPNYFGLSQNGYGNFVGPSYFGLSQNGYGTKFKLIEFNYLIIFQFFNQY